MNWNVVAGAVELTGALASMFIAGVWGMLALIAGKMWKAAGLLVSVMVMAFTNANYALFFILRRTETVDLFGTSYDFTIEWIQQMSSVTLPVFALLTWYEMFRDRMGLRRAR